jgi:cbb3-type cytochrome c oxidase subunit III
MVIDLSVGGWYQAKAWANAGPWLDSVRLSQPYWLSRLFAAVPISLGFVFFAAGLFTGIPNTDEVTAQKYAAVFDSPDPEDKTVEKTSTAPQWLKQSYLSAAVAGVGFFLLSFWVLGIAPGQELYAQIKSSAPAHMQTYSAEAARGRLIYAREGCAYCHTQQVRFLKEDVARFGLPTEAWETNFDHPQLWGTRRVGPDLAREANVRSDDWQLAHLYNPRLIVKDSVMPGYPWLFEKSAQLPTREALDLLAYLRTLGRARQLLASNGETVHISENQCTDLIDMNEMKGMQAIRNIAGADANAVAAKSVQQEPVVSPASGNDQGDSKNQRGAALFANNCASCHGIRGDGQSAVASTLLPHPANLKVRIYQRQYVQKKLWNGVTGSSMPAWRDLPQADLDALATYVVGLGKSAPTTVAAQVADKRATQLFQKNCASCHGATGEGDGIGGMTVAPRPANFHLKQATLGYASVAITNGVAGTAMPPWKNQLTADERELLSHYVRSLYQSQ